MKVILLIIVTLIYKYVTANNFVALWKKKWDWKKILFYKGINLTIICRIIYAILNGISFDSQSVITKLTFVCQSHITTLTRLVSPATHVALFIRDGMSRVRF